MTVQLLDQRYQIIKPLSSGTFGKTFLAEDTKNFNCKCVVKKLQPIANSFGTLEVAQQLFKREAKTLSYLGNHSQIPQLLAALQQEQNFYLVQEFIDGHDLTHELSLGQKLPEAQVITLLKNILEPLSFVHQQGIIHRDIKPANLMRRRGDNQIVLIDFGSVKELAAMEVLNTEGSTHIGTTIGTPGYMPSEQAMGKPKPSSDVYAVGIIGIQALTGLMPQQLEDNEEGEIIWRDQAEITPEFTKVLEKMVIYRWKKRYQTAEEALQALQQLGASFSSPSTNNPGDLPTNLNNAGAYSPTIYNSSPVEPKSSQENTGSKSSLPNNQPASQTELLENNRNYPSDQSQLSSVGASIDKKWSKAALTGGILGSFILIGIIFFIRPLYNLVVEETPVIEETPVVKTPVVKTSVVKTPVVETPVVKTSVVETPVVETPVVKTPVVETPVVKTPVVKTPVVKTPVVETPVVETPVVETPVVETPVVETPVVETPVVKTSVVETPVVETPVVETPLNRIIRQIKSGNEFTVYFDKTALNDEGWTGKTDPMGTLKAGESYQVTYFNSTYTCIGFNEYRNQIHSASYSNADPNKGEISLWGRVYTFNGQGNVFDSEFGRVGTIVTSQ